MITVNEYFDGAVKSLAYENQGKSTVGVIDKGEYEFGTTTHETMLVVEGQMEVLLAQDGDWKTCSAGQQFEVEAHTTFKVKTAEQVAYLCKYR
ncbi:pyrimidine/purine nucleoside phosphorylase [Pedobacter sp. ASV28]|jgi:purine/pyrimidine-nucleoside phosphorylase|uniref:pyrimidine/purine nucleoside phosphorylase n=1 Tax=Pedobacter sp. ASV28 TaxID=2795123 RepID=UPI0018EC812D|nr:pyrimidine/purine nucleoside phosphorylase [Pedobacter sp. ASV28]